MSVIVMGGAGLIGTSTIGELRELDVEVVSADVVTGDALPRGVETRSCDVTDYAQTVSLLDEASPDVVIDLAYVVGADVLDDLAHSVAVNVVGADTVFRAAVHTGVPRVVWASSIGIYGNADTYPEGVTITEGTQPSAALSQFGSISYYGAMKQFNEYQLRVYAAETGLRTTAIRPSVVFGAERSSGFPWLSDLVEGAIDGGIRIPLDPDTTISLIHVDDIGRLFADIAVADSPPHDVYLSGGHDVSMRELAAIVEEETGGDVACTPGSGSGPLVTDIDNNRVRDEFGFELTPLRESIRRYADAV